MRLTLILFGALVLGACATPHYGSLRERAAAEGWCNDAPAQWLLGTKASVTSAAEALRLTGARTMEWIGPEVQIITTGFGPRHIRISYDESYTITRIRCG